MQTSLKCAQFVDTFFPVIDGVVRTVDNYAKLLNSGSGRCSVFAPVTAKQYNDNYPYEVCRARSLPFVEGRPLPVPSVSFAMKSSLRNDSYDIFHAHSPFTMGHFACREARRRQIPLVATFHSKYYDDFLSATGSKLLAEQLTEYVVRFYESADSVWTVSRGTANTLRGYGYNGDIFVVDNGTEFVFPDNPQLLRERAKAEFHLPDNKKILLFVGQQIWQKNIRLLMDSMRCLADDGNDYLLLSVGSGANHDEIKAYASEKGLDKCVKFTGLVADTELLKGVFLCSDLLFFPSVYDNAPLVLREAAAMGVPSLLINGSNAADVITDGKNGFTCENHVESAVSAIKSLFADEALLKVAGQNAKSSLCVSWDRLMPQVTAKYADIIKTFKNQIKS